LLESVGANVTVFDEPVCCGYMFRDLGRKDIFEENGRELVRKIESFSSDVIVNLCPTCNRHFEKHLKRDCGLSEEIEVQHICRFLMRYVNDDDMDRVKNKQMAVGYQDPCWLGRRTGDYDSSRQLIKMLGYELRDGEDSRQFAGCCGYSGLVPLHHPDVSRMVGVKRIDYFASLGVDYVVTSCPRCYIGLRKARTGEVEVLDFVELFNLDAEK
jgi:heterodisulfide reductase subunit D